MVLYVSLDMSVHADEVLYIPASIIVWAMGYVLFVRLMKLAGLPADEAKSRIGTYFALSLIISSLVGLGLLALLVPGIYLAARWLPAYLRALTSDDGVGGSMRWSWDRTEPFQRLLAWRLVAPSICYTIAMALILHYEFVYYPDWPYSWSYELRSSLLVNALISVSVVWTTIVGIAAYELVQVEGSAEPHTA